MAWRPTEQLIEGILDNTEPDRVTAPLTSRFVRLPAELLARFTATDPMRQLAQALRFVAPLSTQTEGR